MTTPAAMTRKDDDQLLAIANGALAALAMRYRPIPQNEHFLAALRVSQRSLIDLERQHTNLVALTAPAQERAAPLFDAALQDA